MDVVIGMLILCLFVGVIGGLFYQIGLNSKIMESNALATNYAIKIAEDIDKMAYDDVTNNLNSTLLTGYNIQDNFSVNIDVKNYNESDPSKEDIIKIVEITVNYNIFDRDEIYKVKKLKIKEI